MAKILIDIAVDDKGIPILSKLKEEQRAIEEQARKTGAAHAEAGQKLGGMTREAAQANSTFANLRNTFMAASLAVGAITAAVGGAIYTMQRFIRTGAEFEGIKRGFDNLTASVGMLSQEILTRTRRALRGMVDDLQIMRQINFAILLDVPVTADSFVKLAEAALILGRAVGRDANDALRDLIVGIGRQSRLILDNLGIVVMADAAYKRYADSIGKTTTELTEQELKMAFYSAAMEGIEKRVTALGKSHGALGEGMARFGVAAKTIWTDVARAIGPILDKIMGAVAATIQFTREQTKIAFTAIPTELDKALFAMAQRLGMAAQRGAVFDPIALRRLQLQSRLEMLRLPQFEERISAEDLAAARADVEFQRRLRRTMMGGVRITPSDTDREILERFNKALEEQVYWVDKDTEAWQRENEEFEEAVQWQREMIEKMQTLIKIEQDMAQASHDLATKQAEENWQTKEAIRLFDKRETMREIEQMSLMAETTGEAEAAYRGLNDIVQKTTKSSVDLFDVFGNLMNLFSAFGINVGGGLQRIIGGFSALRGFLGQMQQVRMAGTGGLGQLLGLAPAAGVTVTGGANQAGTGATMAGVGATAGGGILRLILPAGIGLGAGALTQGLFGNLGTGARAGIGAGIGVGAGLGLGALSGALGIGGASSIGILSLSAIGGPIGLAIGGIIGGLMAMFGGRRQRPSERLVAAQQGGQFMELFQQGLMRPSGRTLEQFLGYGNFQDISSRLYAPGMVEAGGAYAGALRGGRMDRAAAETFIGESRALIQRLSSADIEMSENTVKLVNTLIDMTDTIAETIGASQQQLEQSLTSLISLEQTITNAILGMNPPTMGAQLQAFSDASASFAEMWADPNITDPERVQLLNDSFQEVMATTQSLVGRLQEMASENQAAARAIENLNAQLTDLNKTEEAHRRGLAAVAFDVSLGGLQVPEATRLQRIYMASETGRLRDLLQSGTVTGAERIRIAEQAQALVEEQYQSYAMDQTMSLSEIDAYQALALQALNFIDEHLATGYQEQRDDLQEQIDTQQDILDANVGILRETFGVRTAAEAIVIVQRDAVKYLEAIRTETIALGSSVATELAPLLDATSPLWTQMNMAANRIGVNNTLLDGLSDVNAPLDAIKNETVNVKAAIVDVPQNIGQVLGPMFAILPSALAAQLQTIFGYGGPTPGGGPRAPIVPSPIENLGDITSIVRAEAIFRLEQIAAGSTAYTSSDVLALLNQYGISSLQHGGVVSRTGPAIVHEGETVIPRGGSAFPSRITIEQPLQLTLQNFDGSQKTKEFILETIVDASGHGRLKVIGGELVR